MSNPTPADPADPPSIHTHRVVPRRAIHDGVYLIRTMGRFNPPFYLQLNADGSVQAEEVNSSNQEQQWKLVYMEKDHTHRITNIAHSNVMGINRQATANGAYGSPIGITGEARWLINPLWEGCLISDPDGPGVLEVGTNNTSVYLNARSADRVEDQLWILELVEGTAPPLFIVPGALYRIDNILTGDRLQMYGTDPKVAMWTNPGDIITSTWQIFWNAEGELFIAIRSGAVNTPPRYLMDGPQVNATPLPCGLIPVSGTNNVFFIKVNTNSNTRRVLADPGPALQNARLATVKDLDETADAQKWKITAYPP